MFKYLLEKEFKQFLRNSFLPRMALLFPIVIMLVMPWVVTLDIKEVKICIVDHDHSTLSQRLIQKIGGSTYFRLGGRFSTYGEALETIEAGKSDLILTLPADFERNLLRGEIVSVGIAANAVDGTKGSLGSNYLGAIIHDFSNELAQEEGKRVLEPQLSVQNLFNPTLNYKYFMIPALMVVLVILICSALPALNIVSEKEIGTIEQINVTPVGKFTFIMAKLIPYWLIGLVILTICFVIAKLVYGLSPAGNFLPIYAISGLFILTMSGFGLIVSNYSQTLQQSMFVMFFFMMLFMLMSGLFTPVRSMPDWAQVIAACFPPRYFVEAMRNIYLKGSGFADLRTPFIALAGFAFLFNGLAVLSYRKRS